MISNSKIFQVVIYSFSFFMLVFIASYNFGNLGFLINLSFGSIIVLLQVNNMEMSFKNYDPKLRKIMKITVLVVGVLLTLISRFFDFPIKW